MQEAIRIAKEEMGVQFINVDVELFREKCMPLLESISGQSEVTKTIFDRIEALREGE